MLIPTRVTSSCSTRDSQGGRIQVPGTITVKAVEIMPIQPNYCKSCWIILLMDTAVQIYKSTRKSSSSYLVLLYYLKMLQITLVTMSIVCSFPKFTTIEKFL